MTRRIWIAALLAVSAAAGQPHGKYAALGPPLEAFIRHEMADKDLPALSIALVDGQQVVWTEGFGFEDPDRKVAAAASTVYRVGSVSKLFTDIAIMQLVERGEIDLDAPVQKYLPEFRPENRFDRPVTLRQLMSHRSGLTREPPAGHYFDASEPTLAATVESLNQTALIYEPETHTKYSNAGIAAVGYVLERLKKQPFAAYVQREVLDRIGMRSSSFLLAPAIAPHLAKAFLWTYDGRLFAAPTWPLGMAPAGNLYSTAGDLAQFVKMLFAGGRGPGGQVLRADTLERMWQPQFARVDETAGFGIGFALSRFKGRRRVGHGGAVYGFATDVGALPDDKLGAVVMTTKDSANAVVSHIGREALRMMLAVRAGQTPAPVAVTEPAPPGMEGRYGEGDKAVDLFAREDKLYLQRVAGGQQVRVRKLGDHLIVDDRLAYGTIIRPEADAIVIGGERLKRVAMGKPAPAAEAWRALIGEYGWDHNVLYVMERNGKLGTLIEWYDYYPLTPVSAGLFRFPDWGLYDGESLAFTLDAAGRAKAARVGWVVFPRRQTGPESGEVFRISSQRPVEELRREALAASPPAESGDKRKPDLVELVKLDPTIMLDIRYATTKNFLSTPLYTSARAFLQRPAAEALVRAHRKLRAQGYGLLIHDAYRPWYVTKMFWDATPADKHIFVANPGQGSRHNRGCAVDLTLYDRRTGQPLDMGGVYDEMSERSYPDYPVGTSLDLWHRLLLRRAMEAEGFRVYDYEWWHFDYRDWKEYPIGNAAFEQLAGAR